MTAVTQLDPLGWSSAHVLRFPRAHWNTYMCLPSGPAQAGDELQCADSVGDGCHSVSTSLMEEVLKTATEGQSQPLIHTIFSVNLGTVLPHPA